jgi:hypothetical protein
MHETHLLVEHTGAEKLYVSVRLLLAEVLKA